MTYINRIAAKNAKKTTFIYIISEEPGGPVKVGRANRVHHRREALQVGNPRNLTVVAYWRLSFEDAAAVEYMLKKHLKNRREWYYCSEKFMTEYLLNLFSAAGFEVYKFSEFIKNSGDKQVALPA